jgi:cell division septal protein FtsQ
MGAYSPSRKSQRPRLGSPVISVNPPAAYLRHRVSAARAQRQRHRALQLRRLLFLVLLGLLYFAIGYELTQLTRAKARLAETQVRGDLHTLTADVRKLIQAHRAQDDLAAALSQRQPEASADMDSKPSPARQP